MSAQVRFIHPVLLCSAVNTLLFQGGNIEQELGGRETNTILQESLQVGGRSASSLTPQPERIACISLAFRLRVKDLPVFSPSLRQAHLAGLKFCAAAFWFFGFGDSTMLS